MSILVDVAVAECLCCSPSPPSGVRRLHTDSTRQRLDVDANEAGAAPVQASGSRARIQLQAIRFRRPTSRRNGGEDQGAGCREQLSRVSE